MKSQRSTRFRPTRAGIVNLWDYRDQEFSFADGRLVLRGPNGSGKTKALEVLFPFVLDGRIEPRRLNPFAGEERTMKSNLLYRKQESAHSYVWMEFTRGDRADPEAVTVGIGMRASRSNDKVTRWYFVADGRVGLDFSLLGTDDRPLTRKQLAEELGSDAIVDRPVDYRAAIDGRLFGLGTERYDQLINLILTLRRPQLAKNLDPKGLSQALTDGLRPLDEQMVLDAARSFSDMEEVGRALEGLVQADSAAKAFVGVYAKYLAVAAKTDVDKVAARLTSVEHATTALFAAKALRERRRAERTAADERLTAADRALDDATADRETLQRSSAYEGKQQLDDLADAVRKLEVSTQAQAEKSVKAQATLSQRTDDAARVRTALRESAAALARSERELTDAAEEAGIPWTPLPAHARADQLTTAIRGHAEERDTSVRAVRGALAVVDRATAERARADRSATRARELHDAATADVAHAEGAVGAALSASAAQLRTWWDTHRNLYGPKRSDLFDALDEAAKQVGSDSPSLSEVLAAQTEPIVDELRHTREQARAAVAAATAQLAELAKTRKQIADEKDDAPPASSHRPSTPQHTGAPLWRVVRFADSVSAADAAGIEAALHAADLLDGWVCAAPTSKGTGKADASSEHLLVALPAAQRPSGRTLADLLEVEHDAGVPSEVVADLLASIAIDDTDGPVRVGIDGRYVQGIQQGRHTKAEPEFIGSTARARRRALRVAELDAAVRAATDEHSASRDRETEASAQLTRIAAAAKALPRNSPVVAALRSVSEAAGALRTRVDAVTATQRELDISVGELSSAEKKLRAVAAEHRVSRTGRELDALAAAVRHFENVGNALLRQRSQHLRETERQGEADDRLDEARGLAEEFAEEAAIADQGYQQQVNKLNTLRDAIGSDAEQIDADLARARERIETAKAEQRAARKADRDAGEQIGQADGAHQTAIEGLRSSLTETLADVATLAPYAQPDVLALLDAPQEFGWPTSDAAWSSVEQLLYRIESAESPDADISVLPPEVDGLYRGLVSATESVRVSDAARKSTRSAVTSALQEFDAQLAASGQEFRLHWDAADGLTVVRVEDEQGDSSIADFAHRIEIARREQELLLTDSERRILEDALLTGLAQQIHERTVDARELIARMGSEMKQRRMSSGNTIGVHWVLADALDDNARAVSKLLDRDVSALGPDELATIRAHFAAEIRSARAAHPERSYPEILSSTLDYRRWRVFSFTLIAGDGTEERLTVARHSALSGGEQSVSLHLPLFAAAHVMLSSADPHSPRLLALDEAFAGVDDNGRSELLGLSVQFDLDLFMTGYDLWITYADVPGCAHYDLAHSAAENTVSATLLVWEDGELLAEHDGTDLAAALGSPLRRRVDVPIEGGLEYA
ncbi:TIGR02680 family protein [Antrihabitans cavernicola]|uniref:TIGR02680 family protein n=1 Tax=Antrihabitans cavernicola TaxID=2495913 RepID=A0A5A7SBW5_9NOCA|nr:TIGR02680 family protein [Spelaeibacter cavernicola]KAA0023630.1 TIGR02680 family protein [Spelaeibacter cavernicola]